MSTPRRPQSPTERTARLLHLQGHACRVLGSPLYGDLLDRAAADLLAGGPTAGVLDGHLQDRGPSALALRMLGGAHALALSGRAPELAPTTSTSPVTPAASGTRRPRWCCPGPGRVTPRRRWRCR